MKVSPLELDGLVLVQLDLHGDQRGFFVERYHRERFREHGLPTDFVQDNHSRSAPGTVRGLHYQYDPPQGKLIGVVRGQIWDVAVDLRPHSSTFGRTVGVELTDVDGRLLWVPAGFAHGFCVLGDEPADLIYKVDAYYNPAGEGGVHWADPELSIEWPIRQPILSPRDQALPSFQQYQTALPRWAR